ncbi:hypothetical protein [Nocardia nova]|uniref:hypothetical protein n=1 Tax=Nocardia nova TaxID=37330 RepID=UPI0034023E0F
MTISRPRIRDLRTEQIAVEVLAARLADSLTAAPVRDFGPSHRLGGGAALCLRVRGVSHEARPCFAEASAAFDQAADGPSDDAENSGSVELASAARDVLDELTAGSSVVTR